MSRDRFVRTNRQRSLIALGEKLLREGVIHGTRTGFQLLGEDRYPGVVSHVDKDGNPTVRPGMGNRLEVVLVVRRVDSQTCQITDLDGRPYSELMRITDAIRLLKEVQA